MTKPTAPIVDTSQDASFNANLATTPTVVKSKLLPKFTWVADRPDARDHVFRSTPATQTLVDLREHCSRVENQGNLGSCTGHAVSSAIEFILKREQRLTEISRLFIYYQARMILGTVGSDSGAYLRDCIKACNKTGAPAENLWRYDTRMFRTNPSRTAYQDAGRRKVIAYQRCADFTAVKNAIASGHPVVIGYLVYQSFMTAAVARTGIMPYPNLSRERLLGGHAVCLVGYNDATGRFIAKNSWGTGWGDRGYFYMPYDVIKNPRMSSDFWVITGVTA